MTEQPTYSLERLGDDDEDNARFAFHREKNVPDAEQCLSWKENGISCFVGRHANIRHSCVCSSAVCCDVEMAIMEVLFAWTRLVVPRT